jgi:hypothetical protein
LLVVLYKVQLLAASSRVVVFQLLLLRVLLVMLRLVLAGGMCLTCQAWMTLIQVGALLVVVHISSLVSCRRAVYVCMLGAAARYARNHAHGANSVLAHAAFASSGKVVCLLACWVLLLAHMRDVCRMGASPCATTLR